MKITIGKLRPYVFVEPETAIDMRAIKLIDEHLTYAVEGARYSEAYRMGVWDGLVHLLRKTKKGSSYYFPLGVLYSVKKLLDASGVAYTIKDMRPVTEKRKVAYKWYGPELRDYQQTAIEMVKKTWRVAYGGCVMSAPTGSGKTLMACRLIHDMGPADVLILVHTIELVNQWEVNVKSLLGVNGLEHIEINTMQTMYNRIKERMDPTQIDMLIVDEVHHVPANTFFTVAMNVGARYRLGLSATPRREDGQDLKIVAGIGPLVKAVVPAELFENGSLVRPRLIVYHSPSWLWRGGRRNYENEYRWGIIYNQGRNALIAKIAKEYMERGNRVYIHVTRIEHGETLSKLTDIPFIHANSPEREETIQRFRSGKIPALISTLLGEGVDIPEMDVIILASGGKSQTALIQRIGRVMRPAPGKDEALVIDFIDQGRWLSNHSEERVNTFKEYYETDVEIFEDLRDDA